MNEPGPFAASLIDASRKAHAAGAVLRLREGGGESASLVETFGFQELVEDAQVRLQHLAEALALGRPELFALEIEWLAATHAARGLSSAFLRDSLEALQAELLEALPAPCHGALATPFAQALQRLERPSATPETLLQDGEPHVDVARRFLLAVLEGERAKAESVIFEALEAGASIADLHLSVIAKVQAEMGRMWQVGEVHVAEEHFGSRIVEDVLAQLRARMPRADEAARRVLVASVSGDLHDIGAKVVADHFEMGGWSAVFLGANVPVQDLVQAGRDFEPDLICLSAGLTSHLRSTAASVAALKAAFPAVPILVGGRPFCLVDDLWRVVGADGCASDAADAVRAGDHLLRAG